MTPRARAVWLAVLAAPLVAGAAGTVATLSGRDADAAFLYRQENPVRLRVADVEELVKNAPEPVGGSHPPGVRADCAPGGSGELRNPWRCKVRYRSGLRATFRITMGSDGSYVGDYRGDRAIVRGCCVDLPGLD
jgi:hypothetical protein